MLASAMRMTDFIERLAEAQSKKHSIAVLGGDPQLDTKAAPGIPKGYTLSRFCCEIVEACAPAVAALKPQLAFFEARGIAGVRAFFPVLPLARSRGLLTIRHGK